MNEARARLLEIETLCALAGDATGLDEARYVAGLADSYSRIHIVMCVHRLPRLEWFRLLGGEWTGCDNLWSWRAELREILKRASRGELDAMMEPAERAALALLPERIIVYRGCYSLNRAGLSWTLDRAQAERFPRLMRFRKPGKQPILRIGTAARERVVLKLDRNEQEIIAHQVWNIREEPLPEASD